MPYCVFVYFGDVDARKLGSYMGSKANFFDPVCTPKEKRNQTKAVHNCILELSESGIDMRQDLELLALVSLVYGGGAHTKFKKSYFIFYSLI